MIALLTHFPFRPQGGPGRGDGQPGPAGRLEQVPGHRHRDRVQGAHPALHLHPLLLRVRRPRARASCSFLLRRGTSGPSASPAARDAPSAAGVETLRRAPLILPFCRLCFALPPFCPPLPLLLFSPSSSHSSSPFLILFLLLHARSCFIYITLFSFLNIFFPSSLFHDSCQPTTPAARTRLPATAPCHCERDTV